MEGLTPARGSLLALLAFCPLVWAQDAATPPALPPCTGAEDLQLIREHRFEAAVEVKRKRLAALDPARTDAAAAALSICLRASIAGLLGRLERPAEALALAEPAVREAHARLGPEHADTLNAELMLASAYGKAARYQDEIRLLQSMRPRVARRYGAASPEMRNVLHNLSTVYHWVRNYGDALPLDREALAISQKQLREGKCMTIADCRLSVARDQGSLAESLRRANQPAEALPLARASAETTAELSGPLHPNTLDARLILASAMAQNGERAAALEIERDVLALAEKALGAQHPLTRKARNNLAVSLAASGRNYDAVALDRQQLAAVRERQGANHPETLLALNNLAAGLLRAGDLDGALPILEEALAAMLATRAGLAFDERLTLNWQAEWRRVVDTYVKALMRKNRHADAFLVLEHFKTRLLADRLSLDPAERGLDEQETRELRRLKRSLGSLEQNLAIRRSFKQASAKEERQREELLERIGRLQKSAPPPVAALPSARNAPGWYAALARAEADSARVSYAMVGDLVYAFVDTGGRIGVALVGDAEAITESVEAYRVAMRARAGAAEGPVAVWKRPMGGFSAGPKPPPHAIPVPEPQEVAQYLGDMMLKPLRQYLAGRKRILISPDQMLAHVPFDALPLEGKRLGDTAEVVLLPSFTLYPALAQRRESYRQSARAGFLGFGGAHYQRIAKAATNIYVQRERAPAFQPMDMKVLAQSVRRNPDKIGQAMMALTLGFRDLPASGAEVKIIAERMGPSAAALTGEHASEANVYKLADDGGLARFRVLHFSTHGFLSDDEPGLSAIVLSQVNRAPGTDGYLTVAEIAPLELRSDLVVVSACDSGAGRLQRGEGLLGLSYALFQAGTVSSIVSLWPIPDKASADFMVRFYEEWTPGTSPAAALAQTKRWALQKGLPAHMVDAFVYFGI